MKDSNDPEVGPVSTHAGARHHAHRAPGTVRCSGPVTELKSGSLPSVKNEDGTCAALCFKYFVLLVLFI